MAQKKPTVVVKKKKKKNENGEIVCDKITANNVILDV